MRPRPGLIAVALAAVFAGTASAAPVKAVRVAGVKALPAASTGYVAYSLMNTATPGLFDLWVKPTGQPRFKVNQSGTSSFVGSIDGDTLVFEQRQGYTGKGDLKSVDLLTKTVTDIPGVNTGRHEAGPALSGDLLVFTRSRKKKITSPRQLILRDLNALTQQVLDQGTNAYVQTGGIAGDYVVWTRCRAFDRCRTHLYDVGSDTKRILPSPTGKSQWAATVTADGTAYYAESRSILCGPRKVVRIWRQPLVGARKLVWQLKPGRDPSGMSAVDVGGGDTELYFDRFDCRTGQTAILKIGVPGP